MYPIPLHYVFIFGALTGALGAYLAHKRGKDPYLWFFICFFCGLLGVIFLFFWPKEEKKQEKPEPLKAPLAPPACWYYLDSANKPIGPMSYESLQKLLDEGVLNQESYIWHEEWKDWKKFSEIERT